MRPRYVSRQCREQCNTIQSHTDKEVTYRSVPTVPRSELLVRNLLGVENPLDHQNPVGESSDDGGTGASNVPHQCDLPSRPPVESVCLR